jgi:Flp pilus assembly pilin Flp
MIATLVRLVRGEQGATAVEYSLFVARIAIAAVGVLRM